MAEYKINKAAKSKPGEYINFIFFSLLILAAIMRMKIRAKRVDAEMACITVRGFLQEKFPE
jgi:hypothetical protein